MSEQGEAWELSEQEFPSEQDATRRLRFLLRYAILAPSIYNTQPWRFQIQDGAVELYADRTRSLPVADPRGRELILSCGGALLFLRLALRRFGYNPRVELLPEPGRPDLLARLRAFDEAAPPTPEELLLFRNITRRRTSRQGFLPRRPPEALLAALEQAAVAEGAWLALLEEPARAEAVRLVEEADRRLWSDERYRKEVAEWIRHDRDPGRDGISGHSLGLRDLLAYAGPLLLRTQDFGEMQAEADRRLISSAPTLAVLGTPGDEAEDWLRAGQALGRLLLRAREEELFASFFSQPLQLPELRAKLGVVASRPGVPQILMRLGYAGEIEPTRRRAVESTLH